MKLENNLRTETGWEIIENSFNADQLVTTGSNFMIGNGYLGYRGTFEEWEAKDYVACIVADTWDQAKNSQWSELCNVPNGLFTQLFVENEMFSAFEGKTLDYYRSLDLRYGLNQRKVSWRSPKGKKLDVQIEKFASQANHHILSMSYKFKALQKGRYRLITGIDGEVWSINGEHFKSYTPIQEGNTLGFNLKTSELGTQVVVLEGLKVNGGHFLESEVIESPKSLLRVFSFDLGEGEEIDLHKVVSIVHNNEVKNPLTTARKELQENLTLGHEGIKRAHQNYWDEFWALSDIRITGDLEAQVLTRFNIYQAFIATPTHANLPIGARGLSCQVYQGAAFWDQETFNLKMFIYTHPEIAKRLVSYRHDTLPGAKRKAQKLGYYGAFYAWTSGKTGDELFPDYFFKDVLTGRKIRNHFNCWQIHISPDVVYGIWSYYEATADWEFMLNYGAEILFEVAQFLVSRVHFKKDKNRYEFIRLLGPDEYHENVDNNAYTNYLSKYALQKACFVFEKLNSEAPARLQALIESTGILAETPTIWKEIADLLYTPQPGAKTGIIEQFDGYFQLEDVSPDEVRKRLIDPGEYWGWPNGVAVATQVLKQADVIQLLAIMDGFPAKVLTANYDYYEPRTEHGSSLSPSVHSLVAVKAGHHEEAYRYFKESSTIDLYNTSKKVVSGGSFLGGIHTAAAGGVWLIIIEGFAGFGIKENGIQFKPALPDNWENLAFSINVKRCLLAIEITSASLTVKSNLKNNETIKVYVKDEVV